MADARKYICSLTFSVVDPADRVSALAEASLSASADIERRCCRTARYLRGRQRHAHNTRM